MKLFKNKNWQQKGLDAVNRHPGKKMVYNAYLKLSPGMAEKYLMFLSRNGDAQYIKWNSRKQCFVV